jgi:hypothetical protein
VMDIAPTNDNVYRSESKRYAVPASEKKMAVAMQRQPKVDVARKNVRRRLAMKDISEANSGGMYR